MTESSEVCAARVRWWREAFGVRSNPPGPTADMRRLDVILYEHDADPMVSATRHRLEVDFSMFPMEVKQAILADLVASNAPDLSFAPGDTLFTWIVCNNPGGERLEYALWKLIIPSVQRHWSAVRAAN